MKKTIALCLALLMALSLCACGGNTKPSTVAPSSLAELLREQTGDPDAVAIRSEHFTINKGEMIYLFVEAFHSFYDYYSYFQVDTSKSFRDQFYEENVSWYSVLMNQAQTYAKSYLVFCEAAQAAGMKLDEEDKKSLEDQKTRISEDAASYGWDEDTYISQRLGTNIRLKDVMSILEKMTLAEKFYSDADAKLVFTDEEIEAYFADNKKLLALIDLLYVDLEEGEPGEEIVAEYTKKFTEAGNEKEFIAVLKEYLKKITSSDEIEKAGSLDAYLENYLVQHRQTGLSYTEDFAFFDWAYRDDAKADTVFVEQETVDGSRLAFVLEKLPYKDETKLISVRHVLFKTDTYGSAEAARKKAEEIYNDWQQKGDLSEDSFAQLAVQYSEDGNASQGGIYTGVYEGQMVQTFNDWCFDEARKFGDHGIVDTSFGSHLMFFVDGYEAWHNDTEDLMKSEKTAEMSEELYSSYPITMIEDVLNSINW